MTELPQGWTATPLKRCVTKLIDGSHNPPPKAQAGKPMLSARNIENGDIVFDDFRLIEEDGFRTENARTRIAVNDVLLTIVGAIGRTAVVQAEDLPFTLQRSVAVLTTESQLDPYFLRYYLESPDVQRWLADNAKGTAQKGIYLKKLGTSVIRYPDLNQQRRIVGKLDGLFAHSKRASDELARIPRLVERYRGAVLAAAFSGQMTEAWRLKHCISVDRDWRQTTLGAVSTDLRYGTAAKCHYEPKQTPVLRIPNVVKGNIDLGDLKYASFPINEVERLALREDDLLVIRSNGSLGLVGRAALVPKEAAGYLYAGYLIRIRLDSAHVCPAFVQYAFDEPSIRQHIEGLAKSTSGVNNINSEQLKAIGIRIPTLEEQKEIVEKIRLAFSSIDHLRNETCRAGDLLGRLDQATLAKAFRGELVPSEVAATATRLSQ